jgi:hypothetical protein
VIKLYLTEFTWDGVDYIGPDIVAETKEEAELICESLNCRIVGELIDSELVDYESDTLH